MTVDVQTLLMAVVPTIGVVVWLIRLEGRINLNESTTKSLRDDVAYIRRRIDDALSAR